MTSCERARSKPSTSATRFRKLYLLVTYELERLKRQLFGRKAETVDPAQVQLAFGPVLKALERASRGGTSEAGQVDARVGAS